MLTWLLRAFDPTILAQAPAPACDTPLAGIAARSPSDPVSRREPTVPATPIETSRLPGDARILLTPTRSGVAAQIRNRRYDRLPEVAIVGPSSQPVTLRIDGVAPVEIPLSALDWARLTPVSASMVVDRIVPAIDLGLRLDGLATDDTNDIVATAVARLADAITRRPANGADLIDEPVIRALIALIDEGTVFDAATAADRIGTTPHLLRRVALRWFGFPPKTLLMRRRFLAALEQFRVSGMDFASVAPLGYYDASHFLRDANRFLGTTPRRYLRRVGATAHRE